MTNFEQQLFQRSPLACFVADLGERIISVNPAFELLTGYEACEVVGNTSNFLSAKGEDDNFSTDIWLQVNNEGSWQGEVWFKKKNGHIFPAWCSISLALGDDQLEAAYLFQFADISSLRGETSTLIEQDQYDPLTHLPNWDMFHKLLDQQLKRHKKREQRLAVMLVDLDRFKWINETLGREVGDSLLQEVARRLGSVVRGNDSLARLSSDEFVMLLPEIEGVEAALKVAQRVVDQLSHGIFVDHREIFISGSVGISLYPEHATTAKELVKRADVAMYAAKQGGRNTFRVYSNLMERSKGPQILNEEDLVTALISGQIEMNFLPVYSIHSHQVVAVHAVPYWNHHELGKVPFSEFAALIQGQDSLYKYENWLDQELQALDLVWQQFPNLRFISFRLEGQQLQNKEAVQNWLTKLNQYQRNGRYMLDVDLSTAYEKEGELFDLMNSDVQLAVSGFAHQAPQLEQLKDIHPDIIRIDPELVMTMGGDEQRQKIVDSVLDIADQLSIEVLADGVSTAGQRGQLMGQGCMLMQGRYFGLPLTLQQLLEHLAVEH